MRPPTRSAGRVIPGRTYTQDGLNRRRGKTGIAASGAPRAFAMMYDDIDSSAASYARSSSMRSWRGPGAASLGATAGVAPPPAPHGSGPPAGPRGGLRGTGPAPRRPRGRPPPDGA